MMVGIRSKRSSERIYLNKLFHFIRWDTWAEADVLQKRTDKTEELFNKMNATT